MSQENERRARELLAELDGLHDGDHALERDTDAIRATRKALDEAVEAVAEEQAFDQPCKFGNRVDGHAVYCHNDEWLEGPRKCRRSWYTGGVVRDEDCPGFAPNDRGEGVG